MEEGKQKSPLTEKEMLKFLEDLKPDPNERKIVLWSGCRTNGMINLSSDELFPDLCSDPLCKTCVGFNEAMQEGLNEMLKNTDKDV